MPQIFTFLGKGGSGRTTVAIAAAKQQASLGQRVLFVSQDPTPATGILWGIPLTDRPQAIGANLEVVQIQAAAAIERGWEEVKQIEARYLRSPILRNIYGQELSILAGMDSAVSLNALRQYDASGKYDIIIYDGTGDMTTIGMAGMPDALNWYLRRFRAVIEESDLWKTISPILQPALAAVLTVAWTGESVMSQPFQEATNFLDKSTAIVSDPRRVVAYLVTTPDSAAIAVAKYFWGSAQQSNLAVAGLIVNQGNTNEEIAEIFEPLSIASLPTKSGMNWQPLMDAMPDFKQAASAPKSMTIDTVNREVRLYLPGFDKSQVKLTQSGPEITVEAGDRRRNIFLPPPLTGAGVRGAKFQHGYLIISL
jgi:anion-transporting  ArsA/GET3 family ATPase